LGNTRDQSGDSLRGAQAEPRGERVSATQACVPCWAGGPMGLPAVGEETGMRVIEW
jgi:hypothetical protein